MSREIHHPPNPRGATSAEQRAIDGMHRAFTAGGEAEARRELGTALALVVELIRDRASRRGFDAAYDTPTDGD